MPALRRSFSMTYRPMAPFCCASPPLVVVRRMPSDTSNTWKMMMVPIRAMAIATISSTMLMPACRMCVRMVSSLLLLVPIHGRGDRVVVRRKVLRFFLRVAPEDLDLHRRALRGAVGDRDHRL